MRKQKAVKFLKDNYTGWLFCLPLIIGLAVFTAYPMICSLVYSFHTDVTIINGKVFMKLADHGGFGNYVDAFTNYRETVWMTTKNTVLYTVLNVPISLITSYFLALLINSNVKGVKVYRVLYYLPCMIPAVASGLLWKDMFDPTYGVFNKILGYVGLGPYRFFSDANSALPSVFVMNLWSVGSSMVLWLSAFKNIGKHYYEAADLDGANAFVKLIHITLPMSTSTIFFNVITSMIGSLQYTGTLTFASRDGRGPENSLYMFGVYIYREAFTRDRLGYASALAWMLLIVIAVITFLLFKSSKWVFYEEEA